jgi:alpha-galactosidase
MFSAPLMMGCDVRKMNQETKEILLNKELIAIDQDPLGKQAIRVFRKDGLEAWKKPLSNDRVAIAVLNRNSVNKEMTVPLKELELDSANKYDAYDVWKHATAGSALVNLSASLQSHESKVFILTTTKK